MSHNRRTLQDGESLVLERPLTQPNGGTGVGMVAGVTPQADAEFWLFAKYFSVANSHRGSRVPLTLPQSLRNNKTVGLVASERAAAYGD